MIRQLKSGGRYYYQFIKDGKRYNGVCEGCATKREAEAYEKKIKATVCKAVEQKTVKALVENFRDELTGGHAIKLIDAFSAYLKKPTKRQPGSRQIAQNRTYWNDFQMFMATRFSDIKSLGDVTRQHAEEYVSMLRDSGAFVKAVTLQQSGKAITYTPRNEQLSPRTINARHKAIKAVFSRLKEEAGLLNNPFDIPTLDNDTTSRDAFTDDELRRIGENMTMPYTRPIFTIGLCTGLTLGDICLLRWSEVSGNWITNKCRRKTGVKLEIPILPPLAVFLNEQRLVTGSEEYVCPELADMYLQNSSGIVYRVREFLESLGIQTASKIEGRSRAVSTKAAHAMRHTFAYLAGVYSIPQPIVQGVLGHMSPEMTALYQRHAEREKKEHFFKQMPNVLGVSGKDPVVLIADSTDPERAELHKLADTLPISKIQEILKQVKEA